MWVGLLGRLFSLSEAVTTPLLVRSGHFFARWCDPVSLFSFHLPGRAVCSPGGQRLHMLRRGIGRLFFFFFFPSFDDTRVPGHPTRVQIIVPTLEALQYHSIKHTVHCSPRSMRHPRHPPLFFVSHLLFCFLLCG